MFGKHIMVSQIDSDIKIHILLHHDFIYGGDLSKSKIDASIETSFDRYYERKYEDDDGWLESYEARVPTIPFPVKFAIKRYFQVWGKLTDDLFERAFVFCSAEKLTITSPEGKRNKRGGLIDTARLLASQELKNEYPLIKKIFAKEAFRLLKLGLVKKNSQGEWTPVDIAQIYPEIPLLSSEAVTIIRNRAKNLANSRK